MIKNRAYWLLGAFLLCGTTAYAENDTQIAPTPTESVSTTVAPSLDLTAVSPLLTTPMPDTTTAPSPSTTTIPSPSITTETYINPYLTPMQRSTTDNEGNRYTGTFVNGQPEGIVEINYADGRFYVGEFSNWAASGQGEMTYPGNLKFNGLFQDNFPKQGKLLLEDGKSFQEGTFRRDEPILLAFEKGTADLQRDAQLGKKIVKSRWVGQFQGENMTKGKILFSNGDEFSGACNVNPAHQFSERFGYYHPTKQGTYRFKNGDVFKGTWSYSESKNSISAKGTFQKKNQKPKSATWNNGKINVTALKK